MVLSAKNVASSLNFSSVPWNTVSVARLGWLLAAMKALLSSSPSSDAASSSSLKLSPFVVLQRDHRPSP